MFVLFAGNETSRIAKESVKMKNMRISRCNYGLDVYQSQFNPGTLKLENFILQDNRYSIRIYNSKLDVYLKHSLIKRNSYGILLDYGSATVTGKIENCTFADNTYAINSNMPAFNITILNSLFERNNRALNFYNYYASSQYLMMQNCNITLSQQETIYVRFRIRSGSYLQFVIRNNTFIKNSEKIIKIESLDSNSRPSFKEYLVILESNTFVDNITPAKSGILDIQFPGLVEIRRNKFQRNKCSYVCKLEGLVAIDSRPIFKFRNNILENNVGISGNFPETRFTGISTFTFGIFGNNFQDIKIQRNIFNNQLMKSELFMEGQGYPCVNGYYVDARYNWWGTSDVKKIESRIFDLEDWNDRKRVMFLPVSTTRNLSYFKKTIPFQNASVIGGLIYMSKHLTVGNSPYIVERDLTVDENSSITIDPGVTLLFKPEVGLLVLGNIFAVGSTHNPIKFCSFAAKCTVQKWNPQRCSSKLRSIRSNSGYKFLQIYVNGSWKYVCWRNFYLSNARVACRELGFEDALSFEQQNCGNYVPMIQKSFSCSGNERSLLKCPSTYSYCHSYYYSCLTLVCTANRKTWGNIRIASIDDSVRNSMHINRSVLENIYISNAGYLHNGEEVPSLQIVNRFLSIKDVIIANSFRSGIQVIGPASPLIFENITINNSCSTGLSIFGIKETVVVRKSQIFGTRRGNAIVIAPMESLSFVESLYGLPSICDCQSRLFINDRSYVYLNQYFIYASTNWLHCSKVIYSPKNTTLILRLYVSPVFTYYSSAIDVYNGNTTGSNRIARFDYWNNNNQGNLEVESSTNSMLFVAMYERLNKEFFAEIIVNRKGRY